MAPRPSCTPTLHQAPLFSEEAARSNSPRFAIADLLQETNSPVSDADAADLARMFCAEEIKAILAGHPIAPRADRQAAKKRKRPPPPPRPAAKRPRKKLRRHKAVAARLLRRQFRAPEPSRGRTLLRCQCAELAGGGRRCALHQDTGEGGEWAREMRRRVPLAAGPGEVRVPRLTAGDSNEAVIEYGRWRRSVWMPSRFYLEHAAGQSVARQQQGDGMMTDG